MKDKQIAPLKTRHRIIHINHHLATGDFFTIQNYDFSVVDYELVKDRQDYLMDRFYSEAYTIGNSGDAYGKWTKLAL